MNQGAPLRFACDAMMRGLARGLRACGYDATWTYGIADDALLAHARREHRVVLTADSGILIRKAVKAGRPAALFVPNDLPPTGQTRLVMAAFDLALRPSRCLACGGATHPVPKESVRAEAPPRTFVITDQFERCERCRRLLWKGTHWQRIDELRRKVAAR